VIWTATELELEQIREYLEAVHPGRKISKMVAGIVDTGESWVFRS
jgi:hypothetical protein